MKLSDISNKLKRRLDVHLVAYHGDTDISTLWLDGYEKAIEDACTFLRQLELYEPYQNETL